MKIDYKSAAVTLRQKVEELMKEKSLNSDQEISKTEIFQLIHELQVHQIELELQNEELLHSRADSDILRQKYTELFDFAPVGYLILSGEGEIVDLNLRASQLLVKERIYLKSSRFGFFVSEKDLPEFTLFLSRLFTSGTKESCELELDVNGSRPLFVKLKGIVSENSEQCLVAVIDITEHKLSEEVIRSSELRYRMLLELATDAFFHGDQNGDFIIVNSAAIGQTGYSREELLHMNMKGLFSAETLIRQPLKYEQLKGGEIINSERTLIRKDGTPITVEMHSRMMPDGTYQSFFRDITERNRLDKALKRKLNELEIYYELAITRERKMIALKSEINLLLEKLGEKPKY